jgi:hypothetical protein
LKGNSSMLKRKLLIVGAVVTGLLVAGFATVSTNAQGPATPAATATSAAPGGPLGGRIAGDLQALFAYRACSTTNYTDVAAKALGISDSDLRVALVSGKTLDDLAKDKNVSIDTVKSAISDAQKAEVAQAVKDGVITQAQADFVTNLLQRLQNAPNVGRGRGGPGNGGPGGPAAAIIGGLIDRFGFGISPYNTVNDFVISAQTIDVSCASLLVAVQQGKQSIAQVAQGKNVQAQTVIDALVKAHTDALNQDVTEGLITKAEMAGRSVNLVQQMTAFVNAPGGISFGRGIIPCPRDQQGGRFPCPGPNQPGLSATAVATSVQQ